MIDDTVHLQFIKEGLQTDNKYSKLWGNPLTEAGGLTCIHCQGFVKKRPDWKMYFVEKQANQWRAPSRRATGCPSGVTDWLQQPTGRGANLSLLLYDRFLL